VTVQVGRNGRITPVAELEPVLLAGSTIARATLHNEDYVNQLELALGDSVAISKRGDVIPAVERVVEPNGFGNTTWRFPAQCPSCASLLVKDGAHHFCRNRDCPARRIGVLAHFCGKGGLDIEGLGEKTVELLYEKGFVRVPEELFSFDWQRLVLEDGFGPKKVENIIAGLAACRTRPFRNLLIALGIEALGKRAAELLVENGYDSMEKILADAAAGRWEGFAAIEGFAELTARQLVAGFSDAELRARIGALAAAGLPMAELRAAGESLPQVFAGQRWCVTGSFVNFAPRELAMEEVKKRGGAVVTGVSTKTTHLLAGSGAGSKLAKARELGVIVVDEAAFLVLLDTDGGVQGELPL
jgi:DNA ligase (NAD+)